MASNRSVTGKPCVRCGSTERHPGGRCAPCSRKAAAAWADRNRDRKRLRENLRYRENPGKKRADALAWGARNAERKRALAVLWRRENSERSRRSAEAWRQANPDWVKRMNREWRARHPQSLLTYGHAARSRRRGCVGRHTPREWEALRASYHGLCVYCLSEATQRDHIVSLAAGGSNYIENLVPACGSCNGSKNAMPLLVWITRRAARKQGERR